MMNKYYLTAAIPYVNAKPHIGHAMEFIYVDAIRRFRTILKEDVVSLSGGDENALKNVQAAQEAGVPVQEFIDTNTEAFRNLALLLNAPFSIWQKSSDRAKHHVSSQMLWNRCLAAQDIYKETYRGLYCLGCEAFYSPDDLVNGECPEHPNKVLQEVFEENYFFRLSKYRNQLIELIDSDRLQIVPIGRKREVLAFLDKELKDISISRSNARAKDWGVPVPNDSTQRMYVWFDALNVYQSGVGFGWDQEKYQKYWPADLHVIGKGILRFHAVYWPAFLLSAKLSLPKKIFVHDYFTVDGLKMSKSIGNVYDPTSLLQKMGADPLRYYCLAKISPFSDSDFSVTKLETAYNADLANALGNTVSRIATLCNRSAFEYVTDQPTAFRAEVKAALSEFRFDLASQLIWGKITEVERRIDSAKPWTMSGEPLKVFLTEMITQLRQIAFDLQPILPETADKIQKIFRGPTITTPPVLFPRIV